MKQFARFLGFLLLIVGIIWLPKDVEDWPDASGPWRRYAAMVNETTALWIFAAIALIYICWIDARPLISEWLRKRRAPLKISDCAGWYATTLIPKLEETRHAYRNACYIAVMNRARNGKTVRNLKATEVLGPFAPRPLFEKVSRCWRRDLQHNEHAFFKLGEIIEWKPRGQLGDAVAPTSFEVDQVLRAERGSFSLIVDERVSVSLDSPIENCDVIITSDDNPAVTVRFRVDMTRSDPVQITAIT